MTSADRWRRSAQGLLLANLLAVIAGGLRGLLYCDAFVLALMGLAFIASRIWPDRIWFRGFDSR